MRTPFKMTRKPKKKLTSAQRKLLTTLEIKIDALSEKNDELVGIFFEVQTVHEKLRKAGIRLPKLPSLDRDISFECEEITDAIIDRIEKEYE